MAKYGRGLNREIVAAVNKGSISEPFSIKDVKRLINQKGWNPGPTKNHINVTLANAASEDHSVTYKKYFISTGKGLYRLKNQDIGKEFPNRGCGRLGCHMHLRGMV